MIENASHIVVHHYLENSSSLSFIIMVCSMVLEVFIKLMLLIILCIIIYEVIRSKKCHRRSSHQFRRQSLKPRENCPSRNLSAEISSCNAVTSPASTVLDLGMDFNSNVRSIPMTTFRHESRAEDNRCRSFDTNVQSDVQSIPTTSFSRERRTNTSRCGDFSTYVDPTAHFIPINTFRQERRLENNRCGDSSESSAGLYDRLFPTQHEGEIISEPPSELVTFAGQIFASTRRNSQVSSNFEPSVSTRKNSLVNSNLEPSASEINNDEENGSLEWDNYFQPTSYSGSVASEIESEMDPTRIVDVCWV